VQRIDAETGSNIYADSRSATDSLSVPQNLQSRLVFSRSLGDSSGQTATP
jgi:hypothetical protein